MRPFRQKLFLGFKPEGLHVPVWLARCTPKLVGTNTNVFLT
ncbi:hypothetical protein CDS [Bradyrhizobium sp.]|nr:hypothetical protein CDS [Bradyrhizobium sp.]